MTGIGVARRRHQKRNWLGAAMVDFKNLARTFVIAEIGVNHEGDESVAADLIRKAAKAGADAVKFQTFTAKNYVSMEQAERRKRVERFELSQDSFRRLAQVAKEAGIIFFSTPLHMDDVDFLFDIAPIFKVSSGDLTFLDLIRHIGSKKRPTIISTGLGTEAEIAAAISAFEEGWPDFRKSSGLMLMHCIASYPADLTNANLRNIAWLKDRFGLPVGYSDHTIGKRACEVAVASGAIAIEKHFTYRKENQAFHDHSISADPADMTELVSAIREIETSLGGYERRRTESEDMLKHLRRSLGAAVTIPQGTPIKRESITWLRPAWGLPPEKLDEIVGRIATRTINPGELIRAEDVAVP